MLKLAKMRVHLAQILDTTGAFFLKFHELRGHCHALLGEVARHEADPARVRWGSGRMEGRRGAGGRVEFYGPGAPAPAYVWRPLDAAPCAFSRLRVVPRLVQKATKIIDFEPCFERKL